MITFNCNRLNILLLVGKLNLLTHPTDRKHYYELRENNRLVGHWDEISGDGEIYPDRIGRKK